jgi:hypothetical protein
LIRCEALPNAWAFTALSIWNRQRAKRMLAVDSELGCPVLVTNACFVAHPGRSKEAAERCFDDERTVPIERLGSAAERSSAVGEVRMAKVVDNKSASHSS